jgi:5-formyltetrahydrofolate cyclo-ligase
VRREGGVDKSGIRQALLTARRQLEPGPRRSADGAIRAALVDLIRTHGTAVVTAYAPMAGEPGGEELLDELVSALPPGGRLLLPLLRGDLDLDWAGYAGPDDLGPPAPRMREPLTAPLGVAAISWADLVLVPAVAVDRTGVRLGRGGGSFDRALHRVSPETLIVALLYDGEFVESLPVEEHDVPVLAVITPSGGLRHVGHS